MLQLIARLLAVASVIVETKTENDDIAEILALAGLLVRQGDSARQKLEDLVAQVETMVAEDRDPTEDEMMEIRADREALSARIQGVDLSAEEPRE